MRRVARSYATFSDAHMEATRRRFFEGNAAWKRDALSPAKLDQMARGQEPQLLWIGCSDSRAPASVVTGMAPGTIFTTRNIANTVVHSDMSMLSVAQYAIEVLMVPHVAVVGHTLCGGIKAALANKPLGLIDNWLRHIQVQRNGAPLWDPSLLSLSHIQDVCEKHERELSSEPDADRRVELLADLHVAAGVEAVARMDVVQRRWAQGHSLHLHGWKFDVKTGTLHDLGVTLKGNADLGAAFTMPKH